MDTFQNKRWQTGWGEAKLSEIPPRRFSNWNHQRLNPQNPYSASKKGRQHGVMRKLDAVPTHWCSLKRKKK